MGVVVGAGIAFGLGTTFFLFRAVHLGVMSSQAENFSGGAEYGALPYASPSLMGRQGVLFVEGDLLVVRDGTHLPRLCILCGDEGVTRSIRLTYTWDTSFQVVRKRSSLELRRSGTIQGHLCGKHHRRWAAGRIVGAGGLIVSGAVMGAGVILAVVSENSDIPRWTGVGISMLLAGFGMMILFLFIFALRTRIMSCRRIEDGFLYLHGAGGAFAAKVGA